MPGFLGEVPIIRKKFKGSLRRLGLPNEYNRGRSRERSKERRVSNWRVKNP